MALSREQIQEHEHARKEVRAVRERRKAAQRAAVANQGPILTAIASWAVGEAARKTARENIKLRSFIRMHGFTDEHLASFLLAGPSTADDGPQLTPPPLADGIVCLAPRALARRIPPVDDLPMVNGSIMNPAPGPENWHGPLAVALAPNVTSYAAQQQQQQQKPTAVGGLAVKQEAIKQEAIKQEYQHQAMANVPYFDRGTPPGPDIAQPSIHGRSLDAPQDFQHW
ncbi:hypothetical protein AK830_g1502 [Neonectria ditissima]|uniref:Uncharacterized protein n=1 Tax=Neonectria ditissima TaxID=78410 RepID=A0A0P7BUP8_9HYPO|nr:hypothetical protein AK830_g1502 [Neonectria ditissima]